MRCLLFAAMLLQLVASTVGVISNGCAAAERPIDREIKHIVIFMQENRAFDHYYGSLQGVRGFNDRTATPTRLGKDTFYQPIPKEGEVLDTDPKKNYVSKKKRGGALSADGDSSYPYEDYMIPFPLRSLDTSAMCAAAPTMDFYVNMDIIADGRFDAWNTARPAGMGMGYFDRTDFPYYYRLFDHFLVGDHYFQSTFTETNPNRLHLFSGTNGLSVGHYPIIYDEEPLPGWEWETIAETLENANVSWRLYQELDNFDDNGFAWFEKFRFSLPGSVWWDKGMYRSWNVTDEFEQSIKNGTLPQVSWIVAPEWQAEHATNHPPAGEALSSRLLKVVQKYPETYKHMAFILNYDEGGQFYDHLWTPMPPLNTPHDGQSTVTTANETFKCNDFKTLESFNECPEEFYNVTVTNGMGYRVPLLVVSPWTRGNKVTSEVFDHTSVVQLIETRFNITCPNISPWRRAVAGNMASVFDFENPDYSWPDDLPNTDNYALDADLECLLKPPPHIPAKQKFPVQEQGIRTALALPYDQDVDFSFFESNSSVVMTLTATGTRPSVYMWYNSRDILTVNPQRFQVEPGKTVIASMTVLSTTNYSVSLHGTNGYVRQVAGTSFPSSSSSSSSTSSSILWFEHKANSSCSLKFRAAADGDKFIIRDNAYGFGGPWIVDLPTAGSVYTLDFNLTSSGRWYDFTVDKYSGGAGPEEPVSWFQRFMGHVENGEDSISDPAMSAGIPGNLYKGGNVQEGVSSSSGHHRDLPDYMRFPKRKEGRSKDSKWYNMKDEL